jgi:hypothetical protein
MILILMELHKRARTASSRCGYRIAATVLAPDRYLAWFRRDVIAAATRHNKLANSIGVSPCLA